jgi:hypothetical protein
MRDPDIISSGTNSAINLKYNTEITQPSITSVSINVQVINMTQQPDSYSVSYQKLLSNGAPDTNYGSYGTVTSTSLPILVTGLNAGARYEFTTKAWVGSTYGNSILDTYTMSKSNVAVGVVGGTSTPQQLTSGKSYLTLSQKSSIKGTYSTAYRTFNSIDLSSTSDLSIQNLSGLSQTIKNYLTTKYYSFGTSIFMSSNIDNLNQEAGMSFFVDGQGCDGYAILIENLASAASKDRKAVRIVKTKGKQMKLLADTQKTESSALQGVFAGKAYNIDVKVKVSGTALEIVAYVNGFKITATDQYDNNEKNGIQEILPPTQTVGLICGQGTAYFDYIYGLAIDQAKYEKQDYQANIYQGQFANDLIDVAFGNILYNNLAASDDISRTKVALDEFGTVAREILYVNTKFDKPVYPVRLTTGSNTLVNLLGSKVSNFGMEAYVLNNSSTTIPLADGGANTFLMYGNTLGDSGTLEYTTDDLGEFVTKEPVIFESSWLQNENDVKSLANWIKDHVVNRGKIVTIPVFGNPLISVGDIITARHEYVGFHGTEKMIVVSINHSYDQGLETSLVCRTL